MKSYNIFKQGRDGRELLETVTTKDSLKELHKAMMIKYMPIAFSTQTKLVIELA